MTKSLIETILEVMEQFSDILGKSSKSYNDLKKQHKKSESRIRTARLAHKLEPNRETEHELVQSHIDHAELTKKLKEHPNHKEK
jgi:hypothetical protein